MYASAHAASVLLKFEHLWVGQKLSFPDPHPHKTYKYMPRQWILIGQSFLKTIKYNRGTKKPLLGSQRPISTCVKSRLVLAGTVISGLRH